MRIKGWIGLAAGALALGGCNPGDRAFETVIHRDTSTVAAELANIDTSEASNLLPETQVLRSQPGENQLLYTVPGDKPDKAATVLFDLKPLAAGDGTRIVVQIHIPEITVQNGTVVRHVSAALVEKLLHRSLERMGTALEHHDSTSAARHDLAMLLVALAVTSHPDLMARLNHDPDGVASDAMARLTDRGGEFGQPAMRGSGTDPNPREEGGFGSPQREESRGTPGGIDARPMDAAKGTNPNPE